MHKTNVRQHCSYITVEEKNRYQFPLQSVKSNHVNVISLQDYETTLTENK